MKPIHLPLAGLALLGLYLLAAALRDRQEARR
jgi:hypothetical protein